MLRARRDLCKREAESADASVAALVSDVQTLERHLQEQGGAYARNRGRLVSEECCRIQLRMVEGRALTPCCCNSRQS